MARRAYERTGLIPRSIIRTFDRFRKQLLKGGETSVIQEFRVSRYQVLVSVRCLLSLIIIPLVVNFIARTYFLKPLTEYLWNTQQTEIFLNAYQENRAFSELHDFEEKLFFESLIETQPVPEQIAWDERFERKKNKFGVSFFFSKEKKKKNEKLYKTEIKNNRKVLHKSLPTLKNDSKNDVNDPLSLQTFTNQKFLMKNLFPENNQQSLTNSDKPKVDLLSINRFKENVIETDKLSKNKNFNYKAEFSKQPQLAPSLSYQVDLIESSPYENRLESNLKKNYQDDFWSLLSEEKEAKTAQPFYLENSLTQRFQQKTIELAIYYNQQSIQAIINFFGDFFTFITISFLLIWMEPQIIILKSFLIESIYSFSDTTKSFLLILLTDLLVGFHSPRGWEIIIEIILRHLGLPENQDFIFVLVATFPVLLDTVFKYWIFRYLNKISPSTVATYHNMIE